MKKVAIALCVMTLAGCNFVPGGAGNGNETAAVNAANSATNQSSGSKDPVQTADAGVTRSRSLQAMSNNSVEAGGKPESGSSLDPRALIIGRWTDDGNCGQDTLFRPNGTFRSINGEEGRWRIQGDELTMSGADLAIHVRIEFEDPDTVMVTQADGSRGRSTRC